MKSIEEMKAQLTPEQLTSGRAAVAKIPAESFHKVADILRSVANQIDDAGKEADPEKRLDAMLGALAANEEAMFELQQGGGAP